MTSSTVPVPSQLQTESRTNEAFPELTPAQLARVEPHGRRRQLVQGEVVGEPGQPVTKIFVVVSGQLDAVTPLQTSTVSMPRFTPGMFTGERSILSGGRFLGRISATLPTEVIEAVNYPPWRPHGLLLLTPSVQRLRPARPPHRPRRRVPHPRTRQAQAVEHATLCTNAHRHAAQAPHPFDRRTRRRPRHAGRLPDPARCARPRDRDARRAPVPYHQSPPQVHRRTNRGLGIRIHAADHRAGPRHSGRRKVRAGPRDLRQVKQRSSERTSLPSRRCSKTPTEKRPRGSNGGNNRAVAGWRWPTRDSRKCLKRQRPASVIAGRCRLRSRRSWVRIPPGASLEQQLPSNLASRPVPS